MAPDNPSPSCARFGPFLFQFETLELSRDSSTVALEPQPAMVLATLLRHRDTLVTRQALIKAVWGDRLLEHDQSVNYCIRQVRAALGESASEGGHIRTYARRGYRFVTPVRFDTDPALPGGDVVPARRSYRTGVAAAIVVVLLVWLFPWGIGEARGPEWRDVHRVARAALSPDDQVKYLTAVARLESRTADGYHDALRLASEVVAANPGFVPARLQRAEALLWLGDDDAARRALDSLVRAHPDEAQAHTLRGALALFRGGDAATGVAELRRGAELAPWVAEALHYRAYADLVAGDTASARRAIGGALRLDPLSPALDADAGMVYYLLGDLAAADSLCRRGIEAVGPTWSLVSCRMLAAAAGRDLILRDRYLAQLRALPSPGGPLPGRGDDTTLVRFLAARAARAELRLKVSPGLNELRWLVVGDQGDVVRRWIERMPANHPMVALARLDPVVAAAVR